MKFYFDENFAPVIAHSLKSLEDTRQDNIEVLNISDAFGPGSKDEIWIPEVARNNGVVITQDLNIHRSRQQRDLYRQYKLGVIFIKPPSKNPYTFWDLVEQVFINWKEIKIISEREKKPFAFILRPRSKHIEPL